MGGTDVKIRTVKKKMAYKTFGLGSLLNRERSRTYSYKTTTVFYHMNLSGVLFFFQLLHSNM